MEATAMDFNRGITNDISKIVCQASQCLYRKEGQDGRKYCTTSEPCEAYDLYNKYIQTEKIYRSFRNEMVDIKHQLRKKGIIIPKMEESEGIIKL